MLDLNGELIPLVSKGPSLPNYIASGHVEGQAALIMGERGAMGGILHIDNPNGICGCVRRRYRHCCLIVRCLMACATGYGS